MPDIRQTSEDLRSPKKSVRRKAITTLGQSDDPHAIKFLGWAFRNESDPELKQLAQTLGRELQTKQKSQASSSVQAPQKSKNTESAKVKSTTRNTKEARWWDGILGLILFLSMLIPVYIVVYPLFKLQDIPLADGGTIGDTIDSYIEQSGMERTRFDMQSGNANFILSGAENPIQTFLWDDQLASLRRQGIDYPTAVVENSDSSGFYAVILFSPLISLLLTSFMAMGMLSAFMLNQSIFVLARIPYNILGIGGLWIVVIIIGILNLIASAIFYFVVAPHVISVSIDLLGVTPAAFNPHDYIGFGFWGMVLYQIGVIFFAVFSLYLRGFLANRQ